MEDLLKTHFKFDNPTIKRMVGYENENYRVEVNNSRFVLKLYPYDPEMLDQIVAETETLRFINPDSKSNFPIPVPAISGGYVKQVELDGVPKIMRLLTFVEGDFIGDIERDEDLFNS